LFERFTERARQVVALADEEARTLKHAHVGTEHLLLGMLREQDGVAARALGSFDITLERVRGEVVRIVGVGQQATAGQLPFTARAKRVLELAPQAARSLSHNYIGTESLLLALLTVGDGVSMQILQDCGAASDKIGHEVLLLLAGRDPGPRAQDGAAATPLAPPSGNGFQEWIRVGPGAGLRRLLMIAAARALDEGREDIQTPDVLLALTRDEQAGPLLAELGVDDVAIRRALERRRPPTAPPHASGRG
jgi:ATP-dependent Clp protease ATP-binding subunit ClpC